MADLFHNKPRLSHVCGHQSAIIALTNSSAGAIITGRVKEHTRHSRTHRETLLLLLLGGQLTDAEGKEQSYYTHNARLSSRDLRYGRSEPATEGRGGGR